MFRLLLYYTIAVSRVFASRPYPGRSFLHWPNSVSSMSLSVLLGKSLDVFADAFDTNQSSQFIHISNSKECSVSPTMYSLLSLFVINDHQHFRWSIRPNELSWSLIHWWAISLILTLQTSSSSIYPVWRKYYSVDETALQNWLMSETESSNFNDNPSIDWLVSGAAGWMNVVQQAGTYERITHDLHEAIPPTINQQKPFGILQQAPSFYPLHWGDHSTSSQFW